MEALCGPHTLCLKNKDPLRATSAWPYLGAVSFFFLNPCKGHLLFEVTQTVACCLVTTAKTAN